MAVPQCTVKRMNPAMSMTIRLSADQAVLLETIASIFVRPTLADGELWLFSIVGAKPGRQTYPTARRLRRCIFC